MWYLQIENKWVLDQNNANEYLRRWSELHMYDKVVSVSLCPVVDAIPGYVMTIAYQTQNI